MREPTRRAPSKAVLGLRVAAAYLAVKTTVRRLPFPTAVAELGREGGHAPVRVPTRRLSRAVDRTLRLGPYQPRCVTSALVLYRLLRLQGEDATLVIGLPESPHSKDAHAWVELAGVDVGPPPGRMHHREMARFPAG